MEIKKLLLLLLTGAVFLFEGCSCESWTGFWGQDPEEKCVSHWKWKEKAVVAKEEPVQDIMVPCAVPELVQSGRQLSGTTRAGMEIDLVKLAPKEIAINEPFDYRIKVTNLTDQQLLNVVVTDIKPAHMKFLSSDPEMEVAEGQVRWELGALDPKASRTVVVRAMALDVETITTCAEVTYDTPTCAKVEVVEPKLRLVKEAPATSLRCDRIPISYIITNTGSGYACDITISDKFSEGMVTSEGKGEVVFNIDNLGPGQMREFSVMVDATRPGRFASLAAASSKVGGKAVSAKVETVATEPVLTVKHIGPGKQYIGRSVTYDVEVTNEGDADAKDAVLKLMLPEEAKFQGATAGGVYTQSSPGQVTWNLGTLNANESRKFQVTVIGENIGELTTRAVANAYCAETVADSIQTVVSGISAVLLEVVDLMDPVEIDGTTTYVVTVTNQGSVPARNVQIKCMLEQGMEYVSSTGVSKAAMKDSQITFSPLASLAPKGQAKWMINVKAVGAGSKRFKVVMITEELDRTVEETEATMFYK
ncbi:hypothetical protein ACFL3G_03330 [Planctomycetota bacterium]